MMHPWEREIMAAWDAGQSIAMIASTTGREPRAVERIVSRYDGHDDWEARAREASARMAAAVLKIGSDA